MKTKKIKLHYGPVCTKVIVKDKRALKINLLERCDGNCIPWNSYLSIFEESENILSSMFSESKYIEVLKILRSIPRGRVTTYGAISKKVFGSKRYSRVVGVILSKNPFPILYPCHRVVRSDGCPGGFSSGKDKKLALLKFEGVKFSDNNVKMISIVEV